LVAIDDTFETGIDMEYWQYFLKVSFTSLVVLDIKKHNCE